VCRPGDGVAGFAAVNVGFGPWLLAQRHVPLAQALDARGGLTLVFRQRDPELGQTHVVRGDGVLAVDDPDVTHSTSPGSSRPSKSSKLPLSMKVTVSRPACGWASPNSPPTSVLSSVIRKNGSVLAKSPGGTMGLAA
jgi:hypothetical protein